MPICRVCLSSIKCQQFGTDCCRACAAFFRRTLQLKLSYKCRHKNECNVTDKNRWCCRACRLKRCYAVGMAKFVNASLGVCKPCYKSDDAIDSEDSALSSPFEVEEKSYDVEELKMKINAIFTGPSRLESNHKMPLSLCQEAIIAYESHAKKWPNCTKEKMRFNDELDLVVQMQNYIKEVEHIASFCMSLSPFIGLPYWMRFCEIERAWTCCQLTGYNRNNHIQVMYDGLAVDIRRPNIPKMKKFCNASPDLLKKIMGKNQEFIKKTFTDPFKTYQPDYFEVVYLMLLDMWNVKDFEGISKETIDVAEAVLKRLSEEIHYYYVYEMKKSNYASRLYKLNYLLLALNVSNLPAILKKQVRNLLGYAEKKDLSQQHLEYLSKIFIFLNLEGAFEKLLCKNMNDFIFICSLPLFTFAAELNFSPRMKSS